MMMVSFKHFITSLVLLPHFGTSEISHIRFDLLESLASIRQKPLGGSTSLLPSQSGNTMLFADALQGFISNVQIFFPFIVFLCLLLGDVANER